MKYTKYIILGLIFILQYQIAFTQLDTIKYGLKGKIIRALGPSPTSPNTFYAGLKGTNFGSALVYKSEDAGKTWNALNDGHAISPYAADIQAVAVATDKNNTIYAGTWKEGLYKSIDQGASWQRVITAPSPDIRSIKTGIQHPNLVYAATSTFGVMKSTDNGATWTRNDPAVIDSTFKFAWSVEMDESNDNIVYAQSYSKGIWKSIDQGETWSQILAVENKVCWDMKVSGQSLWVAASKSRDSISMVQHSTDQGVTWTELEDVPQVGVNQINVIEKGGKTLIALGSWSGGIYMHDGQVWKKVEEIDFDTISEILIKPNGILIGSWGNGIYELGL